MSKTYLLLISGLIILVLAVGSFAFYRSSNTSVSPAPSTPLSQNPKSSSLPAPTQAPTANPKANQISLAVISPKDGAQLAGPSVQVTGKTAANADVSVNNQDIKADTSGNFTVTVSLEEGDNYLSVTAVDTSGNVAEQEVTVSYTPAR